MKSSTLIASYLWKDTWSRWLEQPSSVLSRLFVAGLLVTVATVILAAFNLLERNLRTRLEHFGVNTIISREMVLPGESAAPPNQPQPDRLAPLDALGEKVRLRQLYLRAQSPWQRDVLVLSYNDEALPLLAPLLHPATPLICLSQSLPENSLIEFNLDRRPGMAVVRRARGLFRPFFNQTVLLAPQGWSAEADRLGYVETVIFRRIAENYSIDQLVSAVHDLFLIDQKNPPQIQSAAGMTRDLEQLQARQAQWRGVMAGLLGLAMALVFGAISVLEFRQNAYVSALLRSFGAPGKALYIRHWIENGLLANLAAIAAILLLACFHAELFRMLGFPAELLNLHAVNPYWSWEIALVLLWVNIGAFLSSLAVAIGLRKPVGEILS